MKLRGSVITSPAAPAATLAPALPDASAVPGGWELEPPPDIEFYVPKDVWTQLCYSVSRGKNVMITGPSGCGKSDVTYRVAKAAGREIEPFNFGAMSEPRTSLIGATHFDRRRGTWFTPSRFVRTITTPGACVLLDEINRCAATRTTFSCRCSTPIKATSPWMSERTLRWSAERHGVTFFATANLGSEYSGTEPIDRALADRFPVVIALDFPPRDKELALLLNRCPGLDSKEAKQLVVLASRQRDLAREGEFVGSVSTRSLLAAAEQIAAGVPLLDALQFCVLNRFSPDGGDASERTKLLQIFQKT